MTFKRLSLGKEGELFAAKYLKKNGYKIEESNYRSPLGEIDLIARDGNVLVFIEVKTRKGIFLSQPFEAVNKRKQMQILKTAKYYIIKNKIKDTALRIDVVSIIHDGGNMKAELLKNAFEDYN